MSRQDGGRPSVRTIVTSYPAEIGILALCAVFIASYAVVYLPYGSLRYAEEKAASPVETLRYYLTTNVLIGALAVVSIGRIGFLLLSRKRWDRVWEPLAIGALGFAAFYVMFGLHGDYFMAPVNAIATLYLLQIASRLSTPRWRAVAVASLFALVAWQNVSLTPPIMVRRFNFLEGRARIVSFLAQYTSDPNAGPLRLHVPLVQEDYVIYSFSCFLHYKTGAIPSTARDDTRFLLTSPLRFSRDRCVPWNSDHRCVHADGPGPGDLIVVLPENEISADALAGLQQSSEQLFHYSPVPATSAMHAYVFRRPT